jgi:hypothetical protein
MDRLVGRTLLESGGNGGCRTRSGSRIEQEAGANRQDEHIAHGHRPKDWFYD